jgi:hypothetical protein
MLWYVVGLAPLILVTLWTAWLYVHRDRGQDPVALEGSAPREAVRAVMDRRER